jgi:hypothetical protein
MLSNQRTGANNRARTYLCMRQYNSVHAYQHVIGYRGTMNDGTVPDRTFVANGQRGILIDMQHAVILNVGSPTNHDRSAISTHDGVIPDACTLSNGDVADDHRAWGNEDVLFDSGGNTFIG